MTLLDPDKPIASMNLARLLDRVDETTRQAFWARNPRAAGAWGPGGQEAT